MSASLQFLLTHQYYVRYEQTISIVTAFFLVSVILSIRTVTCPVELTSTRKTFGGFALRSNCVYIFIGGACYILVMSLTTLNRKNGDFSYSSDHKMFHLLSPPLCMKYPLKVKGRGRLNLCALFFLSCFDMSHSMNLSTVALIKSICEDKLAHFNTL